MFKFADAKRTIGELLQPTPPDTALTLDTPVQFDASLVDRLVAEHGELNTRFAALLGHLHDDPLAGRFRFSACADQLHELRRSEALWLYPIIARGIARDPVGRKQFLQLRLAMLGLARRVLRRFDELAQAVRRGTEIDPAADLVSKALGEYRQRNEADIYPLYNLIGKRGIARETRVA